MHLNKAREKLIQMYTDSLKENILPWEESWDIDYRFHHHNPISNVNYHGVNERLLNILAITRGYKDPRWLTFNQIKDQGWTLEDAKGKGVPVEYWSVYNTITKKTVSLAEYNKAISNDPDSKSNYKIIDRTYYVFNATHINGIPELQLDDQKLKLKDPSPFIDNLIKNMGVNYIEKGNRAYYNSHQDVVTVPMSHQFHTQYDYDATRLHELCHATGHFSRLNRNITNSFGSFDYAKEELRAEISASLLAQDISVSASQMQLDNHKAYIQSWIQTLNDDPAELFKAIKDAEAITDYVMEKGEYEKIYELEKNLDTTNISNTPEIETIAENIDLDEYLAQKGLESPMSDFLTDKLKGNRQLKTERGQKRFDKEAKKEINSYHEQRQKAIDEYKNSVKEKKILPKTEIEKTIVAAYGHPDLDATHAARRMLAKRGISWKTGEAISKEMQIMSQDLYVEIKVAEEISGELNECLEELYDISEKFNERIENFISEIEESPNVSVQISQGTEKIIEKTFIEEGKLLSQYATGKIDFLEALKGSLTDEKQISFINDLQQRITEIIDPEVLEPVTIFV